MMKLTPVQWDSVKSLFDAGWTRSRGQIRIPAENCRDTGVLQEVERLLANYEEMGSFITAPAGKSGATRRQSSLPASFAVGDTLAGRSNIIRFIASGGMGEVYQAEDLELRSTVAIKVIRPDLLHPAFLEQFKNEVQLAKQVTHPNVCRIYRPFPAVRPNQGYGFGRGH